MSTLRQRMERAHRQLHVTGGIGLELERGIFDGDGQVLPKAYPLIQEIGGQYTSPEPSACQIEVKTDPHQDVDMVIADLKRHMAMQDAVAAKYGWHLRAVPVLPNMPMDIYPSEAYQTVAKMLATRGILEAALQVTSFQVNLTWPTLAETLRGYNRLAAAIDQLAYAGNFSEGERLALYRQAVPHPEPHQFATIEALELHMRHRGVTDPGKLHTWVVIKANGIVEVRCFDATDNPAQWRKLIALCLNISEHPLSR